MEALYPIQGDSRPPVAIGGVGGSGTRLIAEILSHLGYYLGSDLNQANDNLWITLLFKRIDVLLTTQREFDSYLALFLRRMEGIFDFTPEEKHALCRLALLNRGQHDPGWLAQRVTSFLSPCLGDQRSARWGWKEPNTHVVIDRLNASLTSMRYIHVVRNGLDMAHSRNQNQLAFWGNAFLGLPAVPIDPRHSLKYWCRVHQRVLDIANDMPGRFLLLNYDEMCNHPVQGLGKLADFLGETIEPGERQDLLDLVRTPASVGRFRLHDLTMFDDDDLAFVASLGFPIE